MKTLDEALHALDTEHAKKREELIAEYSIRDALPDSVNGLSKKPLISFYPLYGADFSVNIEYDRFSYRKDDVAPTLATVTELYELFPGLPLVKVKDGCTSIRTKAYVDALPEKEKARWESEEDLAPFYIDVETFQHQAVEFNWYANIAGRVGHFKVTLPLYQFGVGSLDIRFKDRPGYRALERCDFRLDPRLHVIFAGGDGEPLAQTETPIKWGRGSDNTPNDFTLYFVNMRADKTATLIDCIKTLQKQPVPK